MMVRSRTIGALALLALLAGCQMPPSSPAAPEHPPSAPAAGIPAPAAGPMLDPQRGVLTMAPMLARVTPGVVNIAVRGKVERASNPLLQDPFFRRFFDLPGSGRRSARRRRRAPASSSTPRAATC